VIDVNDVRLGQAVGRHRRRQDQRPVGGERLDQPSRVFDIVDAVGQVVILLAKGQHNSCPVDDPLDTLTGLGQFRPVAHIVQYHLSMGLSLGQGIFEAWQVKHAHIVLALRG